MRIQTTFHINKMHKWKLAPCRKIVVKLHGKGPKNTFQFVHSGTQIRRTKVRARCNNLLPKLLNSPFAGKWDVATNIPIARATIPGLLIEIVRRLPRFFFRPFLPLPHFLLSLPNRFFNEYFAIETKEADDRLIDSNRGAHLLNDNGRDRDARRTGGRQGRGAGFPAENRAKLKRSAGSRPAERTRATLNSN